MITQVHNTIHKTINKQKNIILYPYDGIFDKTLIEATPDVNYFVLYEHQINWNYGFVRPNNLYFVNNPFLDLPKDTGINCIIINDRIKQYKESYKTALALQLPILEIVHCSTTNIMPHIIEVLNEETKNNITVATSPNVAANWHQDRIINHLVPLNNSKEKDIDVLIVGDFNVYDRQIILPLIKRLNNVQVLGDNEGFSEKITLEETLDRISRAKVYINLTNRTDVPYFLLAAMAAGCAVVTNTTEATACFLEDDYNCMICKNVDDFVLKTKQVLNQESKRIIYSTNAYTYIQDKLNYNENLEKWKKVIYDTCDSITTH